MPVVSLRNEIDRLDAEDIDGACCSDSDHVGTATRAVVRTRDIHTMVARLRCAVFISGVNPAHTVAAPAIV